MFRGTDFESKAICQCGKGICSPLQFQKQCCSRGQWDLWCWKCSWAWSWALQGKLPPMQLLAAPPLWSRQYYSVNILSCVFAWNVKNPERIYDCTKSQFRDKQWIYSLAVTIWCIQTWVSRTCSILSQWRMSWVECRLQHGGKDLLSACITIIADCHVCSTLRIMCKHLTAKGRQLPVQTAWVKLRVDSKSCLVVSVYVKERW